MPGAEPPVSPWTLRGLGPPPPATTASPGYFCADNRKLADLGKPGPGQPEWAELMTKIRRKTLVVCPPCHEYIHADHHTTTLTA